MSALNLNFHLDFNKFRTEIVLASRESQKCPNFRGGELRPVAEKSENFHILIMGRKVYLAFLQSFYLLILDTMKASLSGYSYFLSAILVFSRIHICTVHKRKRKVIEGGTICIGPLARSVLS